MNNPLFSPALNSALNTLTKGVKDFPTVDWTKVDWSGTTVYHPK